MHLRRCNLGIDSVLQNDGVRELGGIKSMKSLLYRTISVLLAILLTIPLLTACTKREEGLPKQSETEHFIFYAEKEDLPLVDSASEVLEARYDELLQKFHATLSGKTSILIFPDREAYRQGFASKGAPESWELPDSWLLGIAWQEDDTIYLLSSRALKTLSTDDSFEKTAIHEFTHMINYSINPELPSYLEEGIAGYIAEEKVLYKVEATMRWLYNTDRFPTIRELTLMDDTVEGFYAVSYSYIEYIVETYGFEKVLEIMKASGDFSYLSYFDCTEAEFCDGWIQFVAENY